MVPCLTMLRQILSIVDLSMLQFMPVKYDIVQPCVHKAFSSHHPARVLESQDALATQVLQDMWLKLSKENAYINIDVRLRKVSEERFCNDLIYDGTQPRYKIY